MARLICVTGCRRKKSTEATSKPNVLQILYTVFVTIATKYGLGRFFADIGNADVYSTTVVYKVFSQVAGLMVIGVGKCAVGVFLLRIVRNPTRRGSYGLFGQGRSSSHSSPTSRLLVQCIPVQKSPTVPGHCWFDFSQVGLTVGSWCVIADSAFAILPWFVIWDQNMKRTDKLTVACGLSLGVLSASTTPYTMLIWSATESTVTIMCSSIPVLRPLYVQIRYGSKNDSSSAGEDSSPYRLPMYGNHSAGK
ncbi:hypothetical protein GE09DRAFT_1291621 [Coniochaeta sp. 2T2.1]|nr:hypothetical protein GE09DRAFT_1291621 [Coniochaeta sp. 2T2.1]